MINTAHRAAVLDHLVRLAKTPGWKQYAWGAAKEFGEINQHDLQGLQAELKERMLTEKADHETGSNRDGSSRQ